MRNSIACTVPSVVSLILLFVLVPHAISKGCGPYDRSFHGYTFLNAGIINPDLRGAEFFLTYEQLYERFADARRQQIQGNVAEWQERHCGWPDQEDIYQLVYKTGLGELQQLWSAAGSKNIPLTGPLAGNSFARYIERQGCVETADYLIFAKRCEPFVVDPDLWEEESRPLDTFEINRMIQRGERNLFRSKSHYIRLRYAYQVIRLAHYAGQYRRAIRLYDYLMPKIDNDPSIIEYWALGHKAGAIQALGDRLEAAYLYLQIFQNCPSKRSSAFRSLDIRTDEEWREVYLKCRDDRERSTLYAMRASVRDSRAIEEMNAIYELEPTSDYLEALMLKEMRELEKDLLGLEFNRKKRQNRRLYDRPRSFAGDYVIELQQFVRTILQEGRMPNLALWQVTLGYLETLAGNYYAATRSFFEAEKMVSDRDLKEQLKVFQLALQISSYEVINDEVERELAAIIQGNDLYAKYPDFQDFIYDKLLYLYQQNGNEAKAFLIQYPLDYLKPNPDFELIDDVIAVAEEPRPNRLENMMLQYEDSVDIRNELEFIKATDLLGGYELVAARAVYGEVPAEYKLQGAFNPFGERIRDCINCRTRPDTFYYYKDFNRLQLINKFIDLQNQALAQRAEGAQHFYELGLGLYNISYFGYAWNAADYYRSGASMNPRLLRDGDFVFPHPDFPYGNKENMDVTVPLTYFQRVLELSDNPELLARAAFMAAKCDQKRYEVERYKGLERDYRYFDLLIENYQDTRFYDRIIEECKYFAAYAQR